LVEGGARLEPGAVVGPPEIHRGDGDPVDMARGQGAVQLRADVRTAGPEPQCAPGVDGRVREVRVQLGEVDALRVYGNGRLEPVPVVGPPKFRRGDGDPVDVARGQGAVQLRADVRTVGPEQQGGPGVDGRVREVRVQLGEVDALRVDVHVRLDAVLQDEQAS